MAEILRRNATEVYVKDGDGYFKEPYSVFKLEPTLHHGLIPLGVIATLSASSSLILIGFILCRYFNWRQHPVASLGNNQYVILVLNLLVADLWQSSAFLVSWHWLRIGKILAPSGACFSQAFLLHSGDVSSAFFVLSIAAHTYYTAIMGRRLSPRAFIWIIAGVWVAAYLLTAGGIAQHRMKYFVAAGAWCWVSPIFEAERLGYHYIWLFLVQFMTILVYCFIFIKLRQRLKACYRRSSTNSDKPHAKTVKRIRRITLLMLLYPFFYVLLTLPLSAGRMWTMSHNGRPTSHAYSIVAGSLLTSCGLVDSILYTVTRKRLLNATMPGSARSRVISLPSTIQQGITHTVTVTVDGEDFEMVEGRQICVDPESK